VRRIGSLSNDVAGLRWERDRQNEELIELREALDASRADQVRMRLQLENRMQEVEIQMRDIRCAMQDQYEQQIAEIQRCAANKLDSMRAQLQAQINDEVEQRTARMRKALRGLTNVSQNAVNFNSNVSQTLAGLYHQIQSAASVTSVLGQRTQVMEGHLNNVRSVQGRMQGDIKAAMDKMNDTQATGIKPEAGIKLEAVVAEPVGGNMDAQTGCSSYGAYGMMPNGLI
jgi:lipopolysaccharide biosynthesis regulator YciM